MPLINLPIDSGLKELKETLIEDKVLKAQQHTELIDKQEAILQQLKILNTYLAMMTNTNIRSK